MACALLMFAFAYQFIYTCQAVPWIPAMETPMGIMATAGMSPRPTEAPGLNGIPKELVRRANVQYPPPANWCGFIDGEYTNPLSCEVTATCIHSGTAVGCSDAEGVAVYTTCVGYLGRCDAACQQNKDILYCSGIIDSECGTYSFSGGLYNYNCQSTSQQFVESVEYLADYYLAAIGSTLATSLAEATGSVSSQSSVSSQTARSASATAKASSSRSSFHSSSSSSDVNNDAPSTGLAAAAIGGIAAGISLIFCTVLGLIVWCCLRRRKRARIAASQNMAQHAAPTYNAQSPPPMQQQPQTNYQPVPQQDTQYHGSGQYQPTQSGYFGGPTADPAKDNLAHTHISPVGSPSPSKVEPAARPFSTVSSHHPSDAGPQQQGFSPPVGGYAGPLAGGAAQDYYKQPNSPAITEVDGTQGNPGVPHGMQQRQGFNEVDGTQGNPGVPYNQRAAPGPYEMH